MTHSRPPLALAVSLALVACTPPPSHTGRLPVSTGGAITATTPIVLCPLIDARPAALRVPHQVLQTGGFGLVLAGLFLGWTREEGAMVIGDTHTRLDGAAPVAALDAWLAKLATAVGGRPATRGSCAHRGVRDLDGAAQGTATETLVLVPILDQLDVSGLSSESAWIGGSSSTSGNTTTTTTGASSRSASTGRTANARIRVVALLASGGQVRARHVIYAVGSSAGLTDALGQVDATIRRDLASILRMAGAPPSAPTVTPGAPVPVEPAAPPAVPVEPPPPVDPVPVAPDEPPPAPTGVPPAT